MKEKYAAYITLKMNFAVLLSVAHIAKIYLTVIHHFEINCFVLASGNISIEGDAIAAIREDYFIRSFDCL